MNADPMLPLPPLVTYLKTGSNFEAEFLKPEGRDKYQVTDETTFTGFDAYKKVIDSGVDVVILTTPPAFRPQHLGICNRKRGSLLL